jgi:predicted dehydrogenase
LRAIVVGHGSIGARHSRLLCELGCDIAVVTRSTLAEAVTHASLTEALANQQPDYVVICTPTAHHREALITLAESGFSGHVLVEKPLFDFVTTLPEAPFTSLSVGYNLRFHPVLQRMKEHLGAEEALSIQVCVGQYLPEWRPGIDYRNCYSSCKLLGGGVLRDLSHEFDYLGWLVGPWQHVTALGGRFGNLEIDSEDLFTVLYGTASCPVVSVQLSYLDRVPVRRIHVNTGEHTLLADLVAGTLTVNGKTETFRVERDYTYLAMHRAVLAGEFYKLCSPADGLDTLALLEAAELASTTKAWVTR